MSSSPGQSTAPLEPEPCYACGQPAIAECANCGQPYCGRHQGQQPRPEWCAECVANAKVANSLDWAWSGCLLGLIFGFVVFLLLLLVAYPVTQGPGRGFVIIAVSGLFGSALVFLLRRTYLR